MYPFFFSLSSWFPFFFADFFFGFPPDGVDVPSRFARRVLFYSCRRVLTSSFQEGGLLPFFLSCASSPEALFSGLGFAVVCFRFLAACCFPFFFLAFFSHLKFLFPSSVFPFGMGMVLCRSGLFLFLSSFFSHHPCFPLSPANLYRDRIRRCLILSFLGEVGKGSFSSADGCLPLFSTISSSFSPSPR